MLVKQPEEETMNGVLMKYDGIVLSSMNDSYVDTTHLKIKPKKYITNDYLLRSGRVGG